jgi:N-acetylglucosamine kinase-like BadF-type ATPase
MVVYAKEGKLPMNEKYYAGWDGGGTKTTVVCINENGKEILRKEAGPFNSLGNTKETLRQTVTQALNHMKTQPGGLENCKGLCIGGAGVSSLQLRGDLNGFLKAEGFTAPYQLVSDYETAFYSVFGQKPGIALISGTGAVCFGQNEKNQTHRTGGWGHQIDDEGSGYAIGRDILSATVQALDGRQTPTPLIYSALKFWEVSSPTELITRLYAPQTGKKEIAALAPLCFEAAKENDETAIKIINKAAEALLALLSATAAALQQPNPATALMGGLLRQESFLTKMLIKKAEASSISFGFIFAGADAAMGAAQMARMQNEVK